MRATQKAIFSFEKLAKIFSPTVYHFKQHQCSGIDRIAGLRQTKTCFVGKLFNIINNHDNHIDGTVFADRKKDEY
jgi:hypothetical protein